MNRLLEFPPKTANAVALQLLDRLDRLTDREKLCHMMLTGPKKLADDKAREHLRVLYASLRLLSSVSEGMEPHFLPLLQSPLLIVESLLMNGRVDLVRPHLAEFPELTNIPSPTAAGNWV